MAFSIRKVAYYHTAVDDAPGEAYQVLTLLAELGVSLEAFSAVPVGPQRTQLTLFPRDAARFHDMAVGTGMKIDGPYHAILAQGRDEIGALAAVHESLAGVRVNVYASTGVSDGHGNYGYLIYVRPADLDRAMAALETP